MPHDDFNVEQRPTPKSWLRAGGRHQIQLIMILSRLEQISFVVLSSNDDGIDVSNNYIFIIIR